jgi:hypothetical protein
VALGHRAVEPHRGAEDAARDFERAHQRGEQRARPAALEPAPAVGHRFPEADGDRPVGQFLVFDLNKRTHLSCVEILARDAPDRRRGHVADRVRPFGRIRLHVRDELRERGLAFELAFGEHVAVRADLEREVRFACLERRGDDRLAVARVAQVVAVPADEIRRGCVAVKELEVQAAARLLVEQHVDQSVEKCRIGLRLDRHPFGRAGAGDREMRLDLHALHAALASVCVAPHAGHAAGGLDIRAAGNEVIRERRVGRDRETAVPQLAVEVLGVVALHALAGAEAHIHRAPRGKEGGKASHVELRRAAAAEARRDARIAGFVQQTFCFDVF